MQSDDAENAEDAHDHADGHDHDEHDEHQVHRQVETRVERYALLPQQLRQVAPALVVTLDPPCPLAEQQSQRRHRLLHHERIRAEPYAPASLHE